MAVTRGDRLPGGRRPDQDYDPPGPLVAPGGRAGVFRGRLVVIGGGGPPGSGLFVYSPSAGAGNLIASIAAASGTDSYGNTVVQGIVTYAATIEGIFNGSTLSWQATSNPFNVQPSIAGSGNSITGADLSLSSGAATSGTALARIDLEDALRSGTTLSLVSIRAGQTNVGPVAAAAPATTTLLEVQGTAALKNASAPAAVVGWAEPFAIGGNLAFVNGLTGDGATYDTGRKTLFATGQTVNSISFVNITGIGAFNLGIGTYRIYGKIFITTGVAGGAAELKFVTGGGIVLSGVAVCRESKVPVGGGAVTWGNGNTISLSGATVFTTSALGAASTVIDIDGMQAIVTTAGTLTPQVAVTIAADTYNINTDTYFEILPVN